MSTISASRQTIPREMSLSMQRELDWIVMRALEKDRTRRYESANALAADLQRYLDDEPVEACPPTLKYRLTKYAKRHKGLLTTATVMAMTLLVATGVSVSYAFQTNQARENADNEAEKAVAAQRQSDGNFVAALDAVEQLLSHASSSELNDIPQAQPLRQKILVDSLAFYDKFKMTTGDSPEIRFRAAVTRIRLGSLAVDLRQRETAQKAFEDALTAFTKLKAEFPNETAYRRELGDNHMRLGWLYKNSILDFKKAIIHFQKSKDEFDSLAKLDPANSTIWQSRSANALLNIADAYKDMGDQGRFRELTYAAHEIISQHDSSPDVRISQIMVATRLAKIFESTDPARAESLYLEALEKRRRSYPGSGERRIRRSNVLLLLKAVNFLRKRQHSGTVELAMEALKISEELVSEFPSSPAYQELLVNALRTRFSLIPQDVTAADFALILSEFQNRFPDHLDTMHAGYAKGLASVNDPVAALTAAIDSYPQQHNYFHLRGHYFKRKGDYDRAIADYSQALKLLPATYDQYSDLHRISASLSDSFVSIKQYQKAVDVLDPACNGLKEGKDGSWIYKRRAKALFGLNRFDEALADLNTCLQRTPSDTSAVRWIPPDEVASCSDQDFIEGMKALANRAVELNNQSSASLTYRASLFLALNEVEQARKDLDAVASAEDAGYSPLYYAALLSIATDDPTRYTELCQKMLTRFADSDLPLETHFTAWTCALAPTAIEDYAPAIKLARHAVEQEPENQQYLDGLGAILMRAGEDAEAKEFLEQALAAAGSENTSTSYIRYFLAITEQHLGNAEAAQTRLKEANTLSEKELAESPVWNRKMTLELLRKEAEALINPAKANNNENN